MTYSLVEMDLVEKSVRLYVTASGTVPFREWIDDLDDSQSARINARLSRVRCGNLGDWKAVGGGVCELRIDFGPGYRVYFGQDGNRIVILFIGGTKRTQTHDIQQAKEFWRDYKEAKASLDY